MENNIAQYSPSQIAKLVDSRVDIIATSSQKVQSAIEKAKTVQSKAKEAAQKNAGWSCFGSEKKEAIEALQQVAVDQADCMKDLADANSEMFHQIQNMSKATKELFVLGTSNISTIRVVEQNLRNKLSQASRTKLNDQAREEIMKLLEELKNREDLLTKMDNQTAKIKEFSSKLKEFEKNISEESIQTEICVIEESIDELEKNIYNARADFKRQIDDIQRLEKKINNVAENTQKETSRLSQFISDTKANISTKVANLDGSLRQFVDKSIESIDKQVSSTILQVKDEVSSRFNQQDEALKRQIDETVSKINSDINALNKSLEKGLENSSNEIKGVHDELSKRITENQQSAETKFDNLGRMIEAKSLDYFAKLAEIKDSTEKEFSCIKATIDTIGLSLESLSKEDTQRFENICSSLNDVKNQIDNIKVSLETQINNLDVAMQQQDRKSNFRFYLIVVGVIVSILLSVIPLVS